MNGVDTIVALKTPDTSLGETDFYFAFNLDGVFYGDYRVTEAQVLPIMSSGIINAIEEELGPRTIFYEGFGDVA